MTLIDHQFPVRRAGRSCRTRRTPRSRPALPALPSCRSAAGYLSPFLALALLVVCLAAIAWVGMRLLGGRPPADRAAAPAGAATGVSGGLPPAQPAAGAPTPDGSWSLSAVSRRRAGAVPLIRLHGSNTIGKALAPSLAERFLTSAGAVRVRRVPGKADELTVVGTLQGRPVAIEVQAHGSGTAFSDLANGLADIGMASRRIKPEEQAQLNPNRASSLTEHVLGLDGVAVLVNLTNPVGSLSVHQIRDIFCGRITDWSQVGGSPARIHLYSRNQSSGTYDTFQSMVLQDCPLSPAARQDYEDSEKLSDDVAADPAGIGFAGVPYIRSCKALRVSEEGAVALGPTVFTIATEDYRLSRRLYLYLPPVGRNVWAARFVAFALSNAGQQAVSEAGFVGQSLERVATRTLAEVAAAGGEVPPEYAQLTGGAEQLPLDFRFDTGSGALDNKARRDIGRLVEKLSAAGGQGRGLLLIGFTDNLGSGAFNLRLSRERARAVERELAQEGIHPAVTTGFGKVRPVAGNDTEEGRARNRRVEVWLRR